MMLPQSPVNSKCWRKCLSLLVVWLFFLPAVSQGQPENSEALTKVKLGPWRYLYGGPAKSLKKSSLEVLESFELTGAYPKDSNLLNQVFSDGEWGIREGALQQISGRCAVLKLATTDHFELEMGANAEGFGGWFLLMGYDQGHGYGIYNVNLKTSGSPWRISEFRGEKGIADTDREFIRYACRGNEAFKLRVINRQLTLQINRRTLLEEDLPAYSKGDLILGTYDTQYGPKPLKIYGMRIRTAQEAP